MAEVKQKQNRMLHFLLTFQNKKLGVTSFSDIPAAGIK